MVIIYHRKISENSAEGGKLTVFHELRNGLIKDPGKVYGRGRRNGVGKGPELEVTNSARS